MKIKLNTIIIALAFVAMIIAVALGIIVQEKGCINSINFVVITDTTSEKISLFNNEKKYYAFLPSYADFDDMYLEYTMGYSIYLDDKYYSSDSSLKDLQTDKEYRITVKNFFGMVVDEETLVIMKSSNIPALSIHLIDGTIDDINSDKNIDKNIKKTGTCTLIKEDKVVDYKGSFDAINGRGNSTWEQNKKPYNITFRENTNLLNMGSATKYCLLANACDESNLRDKIAYDMAKKVGLKYSVDSEFVDLYIDDVYYGLYLLTDSVDVGESQVNITDLQKLTQDVNQYSLSYYESIEKNENGLYKKGSSIDNNPSDITGGYLVEIEMAYRLAKDENGFITRGNNNFYVKSPTYLSEKQISYISELFQKTEDSLDSDYTEYIDEDSWVKFYLVNELLGNTDIGSFYFYKDKDSVSKKIYAGPVWDLDLSMGSCFQGLDANPKAFYLNTWGWFEKLYKNSDFKNAVSDEYVSNYNYKGYIEKLINEDIAEYQSLIYNSFYMNQKRWKGIQNFPWCQHFDTIEEHVTYISDFLTNRIEFLDDVWVKSHEVCRFYYSSVGPVYEKHFSSVEPGTVVGELPELEYPGYKFLGYYDNVTGDKYDPAAPVTKNVFYVAKWQSTVETGSQGFAGLLKSMAREVYYNIEFYAVCMFILYILIKIITETRNKWRYKDEE